MAEHALGAQRATTRHIPRGRCDDDAVRLARTLGMELDPWQAEILAESARTVDGKWAAFESCAIVPRQNGKSFLIAARILAGALLYGEKLIMYSAHEYRTAREVWRLLVDIYNSEIMTPFRDGRPWESFGREEMHFSTGARFKLTARTKSSGRGLSPDCVIFDEAFSLTDEVMASVLPSLSARPNPQVLYFSSAATWESLVLLKLRQRGHSKSPGPLAYWEWHAEADSNVEDPEVWRLANPGFGYRITEATVRRELASMSRKAFLRERLGVWSESVIETVLSDEEITPLLVPVPAPPSDGRAIGWGVDVSFPDRAGAAIAAAFWGEDGLPVVTLIDTRGGAGWLPERIGSLIHSYGGESVAYDARGGINDLMERAERDHDVTLSPLKHTDYPSACAAFVQRVNEGTLRIAQAPALVSDVTRAGSRELTGGWVWNRRTPTQPIHLIAATCALHALEHADDGASIAVY